MLLETVIDIQEQRTITLVSHLVYTTAQEVLQHYHYSLVTGGSDVRGRPR